MEKIVSTFNNNTLEEIRAILHEHCNGECSKDQRHTSVEANLKPEDRDLAIKTNSHGNNRPHRNKGEPEGREACVSSQPDVGVGADALAEGRCSGFDLAGQPTDAVRSSGRVQAWAHARAADDRTVDPGSLP